MKNALSLLFLGSVITTSLSGASEVSNTNEWGSHPMAVETPEESSVLIRMETEQEELALPSEILHHIFSFLDAQTLGQLALTSMFTNQLTQDLREASRAFLNLKLADLNKVAIQEKLARFPHLKRSLHLKSIEEAKQLSSLPIDTHRFILSLRESWHALGPIRSKFLERMNYLANTPYLGNLNSLKLINNKMPEQDAALVANILHSAPLLTTLVLKDQQLDGGGIKVILQALKPNTTLQRLKLSKLNLDSEELTTIIDSLEAFPSLTSLDLSDNPLSLENIKALAAYIKSNKNLQTLKLNSVNLSPEGLKILLEALKETPSLRYLSLKCNTLGPEGIKVFDTSFTGSTFLGLCCVFEKTYNYQLIN